MVGRVLIARIVNCEFVLSIQTVSYMYALLIMLCMHNKGNSYQLHNLPCITHIMQYTNTCACEITQLLNTQSAFTTGKHNVFLHNQNQAHVNFYEESIFGTQQSVLNTEVSLFQGCPLRGVPLVIFC